MPITADSRQIPTFDLAISHLLPHVRNDFRFLSSFFGLRIVFHAVLLLDCVRPSSRAVTDGSYIPSLMLATAGALHALWFHGGVRGYLKRQRALTKGVATEKKTIDEPVIDTAITADPTLWETLPSASSGEFTPEDSPLITPYTPSQTPMTLRDSYLFPNISIPTMPNLPTVSIPAIPTLSDITAALPKSLNAEHLNFAFPENLNFGFKDAVKVRWDEQRGKFAGIGNRGRGMSLNLGGLRIRRRGLAMNEEDEVRVVVREVVTE